MALHAVSNEWEHNGYHDSDWYVVVYDDEKDKVERICVDTTRFHVPSRESYPKATDDVLVKACAAIKRDMLLEAFATIHNTVTHKNASVGETLIVSRGFSVGWRLACTRCKGSGKWVNERNQADIRKCLSCDGVGLNYIDRAHAKISVKSGAVGIVKEIVFVPDRFKREIYNETFAWLEIDGVEQLVKANVKNLSRSPLTTEQLNDRADAYLKANSNYAFYNCFATSKLSLI